MSMPRIGGTFAPPLTDKMLTRYQELAQTASPQVREAMLILVNMMQRFNETPDSTQPGSPHLSGVGTIIPLHKDEIARMDEHVPWKEELEMFGDLFEQLDPESQKELRNAAFHLLWFGKELVLDRQPITSDKL